MAGFLETVRNKFEIAYPNAQVVTQQNTNGVGGIFRKITGGK